MGRQAFENYGRVATSEVHPTTMSGRYAACVVKERNICDDVSTKLRLQPTDQLLEIGCGVGNLLIPLSFKVAQVTGVDHPGCLARLQSRLPRAENVTLLPGNFLDVEVPGRFDKILIYSVIQVLTSADEAMELLDKATQLLNPGGRLLIGDMANQDAEQRFARTPGGQRWLEAFQQENDQARRHSGYAGISDCLRPDEKEPGTNYIRLDDEFIMAVLLRYRRRGFAAYLLEQPESLPYSRQRDDVLLVAPE